MQRLQLLLGLVVQLPLQVEILNLVHTDHQLLFLVMGVAQARHHKVPEVAAAE